MIHRHANQVDPASVFCRAQVCASAFDRWPSVQRHPRRRLIALVELLDERVRVADDAVDRLRAVRADRGDLVALRHDAFLLAGVDHDRERQLLPEHVERRVDLC